MVHHIKMKLLIVVIMLIAACTALPYERELAHDAHALPEYALRQVPRTQHEKTGQTDTSDLKTDSSLWWSPGRLYPYTYHKVYYPGYYPEVYYSPYYTLYR